MFCLYDFSCEETFLLEEERHFFIFLMVLCVRYLSNPQLGRQFYNYRSLNFVIMRAVRACMLGTFFPDPTPGLK